MTKFYGSVVQRPDGTRFIRMVEAPAHDSRRGFVVEKGRHLHVYDNGLTVNERGMRVWEYQCCCAESFPCVAR